tara:strand:+ start:17315 stop:18991 length:1677 start_codon:yes stop_codon:yes gene_type:complete
MTTFNDLNLCDPILQAIEESGYTTPTPIQEKAIPVILDGKDVLAGAQTGTGKTAAFTLPILQRMSEMNLNPRRRSIRTLVLTPTRELAAQVEANIKEYAAHLPIKSAVIFGGVKINAQIHKLERGFDILVATPGRLLDHISQQTVDLSQVNTLVLDEADRMLDMGFIRDIKKIIAKLPKKRQNLLFSATYSSEIKDLADGLLNSPVIIEVARQNRAADQITQLIHPVDRQRKRELLSYLIGSENWQQVLVFVRTKHGADRLTKQLIQDGLRTIAIHGNKTQGARTRALAAFKSGDMRVLVATDIAARGLDIEQLPHVVNFDLPDVAEDYVHRIGRTGRASCDGTALSLVSIEDRGALKDIEKLLKCKIPQAVVPGYEVDPNIKAEARTNGRQAKGGGNKPAAGQSRRKPDGRSGGRGRSSDDSRSSGRGRSSGDSRSGGRGRSSDDSRSAGRGRQSDDSRSSGRGRSSDDSRSAGRGRQSDDSRSAGRGRQSDDSRSGGRGRQSDDSRSSGRGRGRSSDDSRSSGRGRSSDDSRGNRRSSPSKPPGSTGRAAKPRTRG